MTTKTVTIDPRIWGLPGRVERQKQAIDRTERRSLAAALGWCTGVEAGIIEG
jgi:hypothetical protein